MDLAKIESGHAEWQSGEVELAQVISQSAEATEQLFKDKGGRLSLDIPESSCRVWADPDRLGSVARSGHTAGPASAERHLAGVDGSADPGPLRGSLDVP